jgi:hypothetical protein
MCPSLSVRVCQSLTDSARPSLSNQYGSLVRVQPHLPCLNLPTPPCARAPEAAPPPHQVLLLAAADAAASRRAADAGGGAMDALRAELREAARLVAAAAAALSESRRSEPPAVSPAAGGGGGAEAKGPDVDCRSAGRARGGGPAGAEGEGGMRETLGGAGWWLTRAEDLLGELGVGVGLV